MTGEQACRAGEESQSHHLAQLAQEGANILGQDAGCVSGVRSGAPNEDVSLGDFFVRGVERVTAEPLPGLGEGSPGTDSETSDRGRVSE